MAAVVAVSAYRNYCTDTGGHRGLPLKRYYSETSEEEDEEEELEVETAHWPR